MKKYLVGILAAMFLLSGCAENRYAVKEAAYPEMAPYPEERGNWSEIAYEAWKSSRDDLKKLQYKGYAKGMESFVQETAKTVLADSSTENVLYSPLNLYFTLSMLAELTDGNSRAQILDVLDLDDMDELRRKR